MMAADSEERASRMGRVGAGFLIAGAGLLGLAGVAVSAAATHAGGGTLATTAGLFLLLHAAAIIGLAAAMQAFSAPKLFGLAAGVLFLGTMVFAADLAVAGFTGQRPIPFAAPFGGVMLISGWLLAVVAGVTVAIKSLRAPAISWRRDD